MMAAALAGCQTGPAPMRAASNVAAPASTGIPYHWTVGNAPQAHKDMVAEFGRVGLKPREYVWAATSPSDGDPRIVVDLLTQMAYVYRGHKLLGASSWSGAQTRPCTP